MGWFTTLFGGSEAANTVIQTGADAVKGIGRFIDEQQWTKEEQAAAHAAMVEQHLQLITITQSENSVRSITRRVMAWAVVTAILGFASVAMVFAVFGDTEKVDIIVDIADKFSLGTAFVSVIMFYFGLQGIRAFKGNG